MEREGMVLVAVTNSVGANHHHHHPSGAPHRTQRIIANTRR
jgi:hypothetical protein